MLSLKIGRSGLLDLSWEAEWFLIMFPTNCEGLEKRKQTFKLFFCCFSFCLLEVSLPQIFQKGQLKLSRQSDTEPARTLSGVSISQSNGYYENNTVLLGFTVLQC